MRIGNAQTLERGVTSGMSTRTFEEELAAFRARLAGLGAGPGAGEEGATAPDPDTHDEDLSIALEELQVASEELTQQSAELAASREQLEVERRRYQQLFELAPDGHLVTDPFGRILEANRAASEMLQVDHLLLIGKPLAVFLPADERKRLRLLLARLQRLDQPSEWMTDIRPRHGLAFPAAISVAVERAGAGPAVALHWSVRDISGRKWLEQALESESELRHYSHELEDLLADRTTHLQRVERARAETEKLAAVGRMAATVAHEVNNPLAGIKNAFALVKTAIPPDHPYYGYVARIESEIDRIAGIMRQLFGLYRPDQEPAHPFRLDGVVDDVVVMLEPSWRERDVKVATTVPPGLEINAVFEGSLRQVLFNLIQNAVDASPAGGTVTVGGGLDQCWLWVSVHDRGPGIPPELRQRIFEPFFTTKTGQPRSGLGLGLPIVHSLVDAAGGTLDLESDASTGTTFRVAFPLDQPCTGEPSRESGP
jgi:PAS domain S-box-containing protein